MKMKKLISSKFVSVCSVMIMITMVASTNVYSQSSEWKPSELIVVAGPTSTVAGFVAGVIGADHHDGCFGQNAVDVAVIQPPQDVFGAITPDTEVHRVAVAVVLCPDLLTGALPAMRDRIADEDEIGVALLGSFVEALVPLHPPVLLPWHWRHR